MNKLKDFVALADYLDRRGFFDAANIIDRLIEKQANKLEEEGRKEAKTIRLKRLADKKPFDLPYLFDRPEERAEEEKREKEKGTLIFREEEPAYETKEEEDIGGSEYELLDLFEGDQDVIDVMASLGKEARIDVQQLGQRLRLDPKALQALTPEQLNSINRMRNPGIARQWVSHYQRQNVKPQPAPQPAPQPTPQPTPQPAPQPTPQPAPQPARPRGLRDPAKFQEYMRRLYGPSQQQPGPGELTEKDFPQEITERELMSPEARRPAPYVPKIPEGF